MPCAGQNYDDATAMSQFFLFQNADGQTGPGVGGIPQQMAIPLTTEWNPSVLFSENLRMRKSYFAFLLHIERTCNLPSGIISAIYHLNHIEPTPERLLRLNVLVPRDRKIKQLIKSKVITPWSPSPLTKKDLGLCGRTLKALKEYTKKYLPHQTQRNRVNRSVLQTDDDSDDDY
eukprot:COSAG04_NODE_842_length_9945_cov_4.243043_3_plen_174_part_00